MPYAENAAGMSTHEIKPCSRQKQGQSNLCSKSQRKLSPRMNLAKKEIKVNITKIHQKGTTFGFTPRKYKYSEDADIIND